MCAVFAILLTGLRLTVIVGCTERETAYADLVRAVDDYMHRRFMDMSCVPSVVVLPYERGLARLLPRRWFD